MLMFGGFTFDKAVEKLAETSRSWINIKKDLGFEVEDDIDIVYDILVDMAKAYTDGKLNDIQIDIIDAYYRPWYGFSIRDEE